MLFKFIFSSFSFSLKFSIVVEPVESPNNFISYIFNLFNSSIKYFVISYILFIYLLIVKFSNSSGSIDITKLSVFKAI